MQVLTSEAIGSWSDVYVSDPVYDALYYESLSAVDPGARRLLIDELQRISYERFDCQLVAYRDELYAAGPATGSTTSDHWGNYGNWETSWLLMPDQLAAFLYMRIQPTSQPAPQITSVPETAEVEVGAELALTASAYDTNGLNFRWFWGDGAKDAYYRDNTTASSGSSTGRHTYAADGYYNAWLAVKENGGLDKFVNVTKIKVKVTDSSNYAPTFSVAADYSPQVPGPDQGTLVSLTATATDINLADTLTYYWVTNDGHTLFGQNVTYQFKDLTKTVATCYADDGHVGTGSRPVPSQVLVPVSQNYAPTISVPPVPNVAVGGEYQFNVTADDQNTADKTRWQFTWDWGDGSMSVTSSPTAAHTYAFKKLYTYTVFVDDMTGLSNHNKSGTNQIQVKTPGGTNLAPTIQSGSLSADPTSFDQGGTVTLSGAAQDGNKDRIYVSYEIWDSLGEIYAYANTTYDPKNTNYAQIPVDYVTTLDMPADTYTVWMVVSDGDAAPVYSLDSVDFTVTQANREPIVDLLPAVDTSVGMPHTYTVTAVDPDGDPMTYWWTFVEGDVTTRSSLQSPVYTFTTAQQSVAYTVAVDDGLPGHNISRMGYLTANIIPVITSSPTTLKTDLATSNAFSVSVWDDDDNLSVNYIWDFGDGSAWATTVGIPTASHTYAAVGNYTVTVYANDMFVDMDGVSHNISATVSTVRVYVTHIHLITGWNLFIVPTINNGYKAGNVGLLPGDVVAGFNPGTGAYDKNFIVGSSPPPMDFALAGSTGYWVYTKVNETLWLYGTLPTVDQTRSITIKAGGGWAIIGFNTLKTTMKASNIPSMYSGASITAIAWFNAETKIYKSFIPGGPPPTDFYLVPGTAYWVYCSGSGTLTYSP